jgi:hypothetical protein
MLIVGSLVVMVGGHWAILQSVAWVGMALNFAQTAPLGVALKKTFDGKNPCTLCKAVNEGKKSEREQSLLKVETKLDFYLTPSAFLLDAPPFVAIEPGAAETVQPRAHAPPRQPPRFG